MSTTHPTNIDIAAALAEAQELYRARNPKSLAQYEAACAAMPGGNTRSAIFVDPFPLTMAKGEGAHLWDLDGHEYVDFLSRVYRRPVRPFASRDPPRDRRRARQRLEPRRAGRGRGAVCRGHLRPLPLDRAGALHQFRHRGQSDGGRCGARFDRPQQDPGLFRRLSRRRLLFPRQGQRRQRAVRLSRRGIQRHRGNARACHAAPRRSRGDHDRADARRQRLHPGEPRVSRRSARLGERNRRRLDLRRGHDLAPRAGRAAGGARHQPRYDDLGQICRRRHELWRVRRQGGDHGVVRPAPRRRVSACRHLQQQCADDECRLCRPDRNLHARARSSPSTASATGCASASTQPCAAAASRCSSPASAR